MLVKKKKKIVLYYFPKDCWAQSVYISQPTDVLLVLNIFRMNTTTNIFTLDNLLLIGLATHENRLLSK